MVLKKNTTTKSKNRFRVFLYQVFRENPWFWKGFESGPARRRFSGSGTLKDLEPTGLLTPAFKETEPEVL